MNNETNNFCFSGNVKFNPQRRISAAGNSFLPLTIEQSRASVPVMLFGVLADSLAGIAQQGTQIIVKGTMSQRKGNDGYYHANLVVNEYSLNGGQSFETEQTLNAPQQQAGVKQVQQVLQQPAEQQQPVPQQQPGFDDFDSDTIPF